MNKLDLSRIAAIFRSLHILPLKHLTPFIDGAIEKEYLINHISAITCSAPEEVRSFYQSHDYTLEWIFNAVSIVGELDEDKMRLAYIEEEGRLSLDQFATNWDYLSSRTWKDALSDVPYLAAYNVSYPLIWLAYWIKEGILQAKEEIWD